jgi:hypothetical protein
MANFLELELVHPAAVPDPQASDPGVSNLKKETPDIIQMYYKTHTRTLKTFICKVLTHVQLSLRYYTECSAK